MNCPKCEAKVKILNYEEYDCLSSSEILRNWDCECPNCGYKGTYLTYYKPIDSEWVEEEGDEKE